MYQKAAAPLPISGVVDDAVRLYRAAFNRAWIPALVMQLLITATLTYIRIRYPGLVTRAGMVDWDQLAPSLLALYLAAIVISLIFSNAVTAQLLAARDGQDLSIRGSLSTGVRYFAPTLGIAGLLAGAATLGLLAAQGVPQIPEPVREALLASYALAVLYLMGRLFLATVALLAERTSVLGALRVSWRVTRGNWWRAGMIMSVIVLIFLLALFVLSLAAGIVSLAVQTDTVAGTLAVQLVAAVVQAVAVPFFNAGFVVTYFDLKLRTAVHP